MTWRFCRDIYFNIRKGNVIMKYRNKDDIRELPEIPKKYNFEFQNLLSDLQSLNERPTLRLKKIYKFLDSYAEFVSMFSVCSKGCAYCCYIDVLLTDIEARLIEEETGKKRSTIRRMPSKGHTSPCPFLIKLNMCSIYNIRPFHCRTFYALDDPKYCKTGEPHQVYGAAEKGYQVSYYQKIVKYIWSYNRNKPLLDIRDYFS